MAACGSFTAAGPAAPTAYEGEWKFRSGSGPGGNIPAEPFPISLFLEGERIHGTAACNHYDGTAEIDGASFHVSPLSRTAMGCNRRASTAEDRFHAAIEDAKTIERHGSRLLLEGPSTSLRFDYVPPEPDAPLVGTHWDFNGVVIGRGPGGMVGFSGSGALLLKEDGTLTGSTGCRKFTGEWRDAGDHIEVKRFALIGRCDEQGEGQDADISFVLRDGFTTDIEEGRLDVWHLSEDRGLTYQAR